MRTWFLATALGAAASVGVAFAGVGGSALQSESLTATLSASQEVGPSVKVPRASGRFTAKLDGKKLTWSLTFKGLSGPALAAHVHLGRKGVAGPVALALCGPCRSGAHGEVVVKAGVLSALESGRAYANVHTAKNPAGEIRGQVAGSAPAGAPSTQTTPSTDTGGTTTPGYDSGGYGY
jgi:CHRD domain-containing protein